MQLNITFKTIFEYILKKLVLCIQIRFVSTEKTTRIASRASCLEKFFHVTWVKLLNVLERCTKFRCKILLPWRQSNMHSLIFYLQFGFGQMFPNEMNGGSRNFSMTYRCYSVLMLPGQERQDVNRGGKSKVFKIILTVVCCYL